MTETRLTADDIHARLRHRAPFLFVDEAEINAGETIIRGTYTFAADTAFFGGHFPDDPIVPGVILLEFVAQMANLLLSHRVGKAVQGFLVGVEEAKFNLSVRPGQTVVAEVRFSRELAPGADLGAERFVGFKGSVSLEGRRCMRTAINIYQGG